MPSVRQWTAEWLPTCPYREGPKDIESCHQTGGLDLFVCSSLAVCLPHSNHCHHWYVLIGGSDVFMLDLSTSDIRNLVSHATLIVHIPVLRSLVHLTPTTGARCTERFTLVGQMAPPLFRGSLVRLDTMLQPRLSLDGLSYHFFSGILHPSTVPTWSISCLNLVASSKKLLTKFVVYSLGILITYIFNVVR